MTRSDAARIAFEYAVQDAPRPSQAEVLGDLQRHGYEGRELDEARAAYRLGAAQRKAVNASASATSGAHTHNERNTAMTQSKKNTTTKTTTTAAKKTTKTKGGASENPAAESAAVVESAAAAPEIIVVNEVHAVPKPSAAKKAKGSKKTAAKKEKKAVVKKTTKTAAKKTAAKPAKKAAVKKTAAKKEAKKEAKPRAKKTSSAAPRIGKQGKTHLWKMHTTALRNKVAKHGDEEAAKQLGVSVADLRERLAALKEGKRAVNMGGGGRRVSAESSSYRPIAPRCEWGNSVMTNYQPCEHGVACRVQSKTNLVDVCESHAGRFLYTAADAWKGAKRVNIDTLAEKIKASKAA